MGLAPLLIAYDAEDPRCRRWIDWISRRDRRGLVVSFPFQNSELVRVAPELAGRPLHLMVHGLDTASRRVWAGDRLLAQVWRRLPGWSLLAPLLGLPGISRLAGGWLRKPAQGSPTGRRR